MNSSVLLQQCTTCQVHLTWIAFVMGGRWQYSCCFVGWCFHNFLNIDVVHPYSSMDTTAVWKKNCVLFYRSGLTSIWPIAYQKLSLPLLVACWCLSWLMRHCFLGRWTCLPLCVEMSPLSLNHIYSVLCALTWRHMPAAANSRRWSRV